MPIEFELPRCIDLHLLALNFICQILDQDSRCVRSACKSAESNKKRFSEDLSVVSKNSHCASNLQSKLNIITIEKDKNINVSLLAVWFRMKRAVLVDPCRF